MDFSTVRSLSVRIICLDYLSSQGTGWEIFQNLKNSQPEGWESLPSEDGG